MFISLFVVGIFSCRGSSDLPGGTGKDTSLRKGAGCVDVTVVNNGAIAGADADVIIGGGADSIRRASGTDVAIVVDGLTGAC